MLDAEIQKGLLLAFAESKGVAKRHSNMSMIACNHTNVYGELSNAETVIRR